MGITVSITTRDGLAVATPLGYEVTADVTFDTDYASSGGEALDAYEDLLFPKEATVTHASAEFDGGVAFTAVYDVTNAKLKAYVITTGVEAAAGLDGLDGTVVKLRATAAVV
jgi:hypothetical protein